MSTAVRVGLRACGVTALALALAAQGLLAQWRSEVVAEGRLFGPAYETALILDAEFQHSWDRGRQVLRVAPYVRWDPSGERNRIDFVELSWAHQWERWELRAGLWEVFWGVSESRHLVDVINQRDLVVGGQGYLKMGQPMLALATVQSWGTVELMLMPWFRERRFDGRAGQLWSPIPVDATQPVYESGAGNTRLDWAIRWSHRVGDWDFGLSHFSGTRREPGFLPGEDGSGRAVLVPYYDVVDQTGVDVQWTRGNWLWKLEAVTLNPTNGRYLAAAGGLEYAFADYISVFAEYLFDSRGDAATNSFADDLFVGARLMLQDGQLQGGAFVDRETWNSVLRLALTWRLGSSATLAVEAGAFLGDESLEPALASRQHDYLSLAVTRYF
jgi:hypothetical protein